MLKGKYLIGFFIIFMLTCSWCAVDSIKEEEKTVIKVVEQFFSVLENRDSELAKEILVAGGAAFSTRKSEDQSRTMRRVSFKDLVESLGKSTERMKEKMTGPKVMIHRDIAVLWAPYKFYINGSFSHHGVDAFSLVKMKGKWRIATIVYTVEK